MYTPATTWRALGAGVAWLAGLGSFLFAADDAVTGAAALNPRYTGAMAIQEWTADATGGGAQTFSVTQSAATGLVYVGKSGGVIEYDGARWRLLPRPPGRPAFAVRGLAVDEAGDVWAGSDNCLVHYIPDTRGQWHMESMLDRLPEAERTPGIVWRIEARADAIWAVASERICRFDRKGSSARSWPVRTNLLLGWIEGDPWFCRDQALFRIHGDRIEPAPVPTLPASTGFPLGVLHSAMGVLQVEHARGILERREGAWKPLSDELQKALRGADHAAATLVRRPDGGWIFSSSSGRLLFADREGRVLGSVGEQQGLTFRGAHRTWLDRDGGLWIAGGGGLRRVQVDGVLARHDQLLGAKGNTRDLAYDSTLWVANSLGLFSRDPRTGRFQERSKTADLFASLPSPAGGRMLASAQLFEWSEPGGLTTPVRGVGATALVADPRDASRLFAGSANKVVVLRWQDGKWHEEARLADLDKTIYFLAVDDAGTLWFAGGGQCWRAEAPEGDWTRAKPERVHIMDTGSPDSSVGALRVGVVEGEAVIYGLQGLRRRDPASGEIVPDHRFDNLPLGANTPIWKLHRGTRPGVIYLTGELGYSGRLWRGERAGKNPAWRFTELPYAEGSGQVGLVDLCESPDGRTLWIGGQMLVSLDLTAPAPPPFAPPAAHWRGVHALEGSEIFYGGAAPAMSVALPLAQRAVRVEFASPALRVHVGGQTGIEYRTRAGGLDRGWSSWSSTTTRELTNLPAGEQKLEVQARNHLGAIGPAASLVLIVPPFWWETWWWRTGLALAGAVAIAAVVRGLVRRQFQQRIALLEAQAAVQNERLRIARDMHDDLGSTLASIVHLSSPEAAGPGRPPDGTLPRVHEAARELVQRTRDIVWAATPQHDSLESLIEQLTAHAERTLGDRGVVVRAETPARVPDEPIGAAARHGLFLAFKEAVNNTAKHARARAATVRIELTADAIIVALADDGVGFAENELSRLGNGLGNLRHRLQALGGSAQIASAPGQGTTVTLRLPRPR